MSTASSENAATACRNGGVSAIKRRTNRASRDPIRELPRPEVQGSALTPTNLAVLAAGRSGVVSQWCRTKTYVQRCAAGAPHEFRMMHSNTFCMAPCMLGLHMQRTSKNAAKQCSNAQPSMYVGKQCGERRPAFTHITFPHYIWGRVLRHCHAACSLHCLHCRYRQAGHAQPATGPLVLTPGYGWFGWNFVLCTCARVHKQ
jgi:hypothetical protein